MSFNSENTHGYVDDPKKPSLIRTYRKFLADLDAGTCVNTEDRAWVHKSRVSSFTSKHGLRFLHFMWYNGPFYEMKSDEVAALDANNNLERHDGHYVPVGDKYRDVGGTVSARLDVTQERAAEMINTAVKAARSAFFESLRQQGARFTETAEDSL